MRKVTTSGILMVALLLAMGTEVRGYEEYSELILIESADTIMYDYRGSEFLEELISESVQQLILQDRELSDLCFMNDTVVFKDELKVLREKCKVQNDEWDEEEYEEFMEEWMRWLEEWMRWLEELLEELEEISEEGIEEWTRKKVEERVEGVKESIEEKIEELRRSIEGFFEKLFTDEPHEKEVLDVPYVYQGDTPWCMLASATMLLRYYGEDVSLWEEAEELKWKKNIELDLSARLATVGQFLFGTEIEERLLKGRYDFETDEMESVIWEHSSSEDMFNYIKAKIKNKQPIMLMSIHQDHAVVIVGYEITPQGEKYIYVHDPSGHITQNHFNSKYPHKNEGILWKKFYDLLGKKPFGALESRTIVIKNRNPNPKEVTIQLATTHLSGERIGFMFGELRYRNILKEHSLAGPQYTQLGMDKGLLWEISKSEYVRENKLYLRDEIYLGDVVGWDVTSYNFWLDHLNLTSVGEDEYELRVYFKDNNGNYHLKAKIENFTIDPNEGKKIKLEFEIDELASGEYIPVIIILKGNEVITEATLPKIIILNPT